MIDPARGCEPGTQAALWQIKVTNPLRLLISYSHEDLSFAKELYKHLKTLGEAGHVGVWWDRNIMSGAHWENEIYSKLREVDVFLPLMSADFFASDYCTGKEMKCALEREEKKEATIIPILVRAVNWEDSALGKLQAVPEDDGELRPVGEWPHPDRAWTNIAANIRSLALLKTEEETRSSQASAASSQLHQGLQQKGDVLDPQPKSASSEGQTPALPVPSRQPAMRTPRPPELRPEPADATKRPPQRAGTYISEWLESVAEALISWDLNRCQELIEDPHALGKDEGCVQAWRAFDAQRRSPKAVLTLIQKASNGLGESVSPRSASLRPDLEALASRILLEDPLQSRRHLEVAQSLGGKSHRVAATASAYWRQRKDLGKALEFARESIRQAEDHPEGYLEVGMWAECEERWDEADSLFAQALDRLPGDRAPHALLDGPLAPPSGRFLLLAAKRLAGQNEDLALALVERALDLGLKGHYGGAAIEAAAHELRGDLLSKAGVQSGRVAEAYSRAGDCYYRSSQDAQAATVLRRAIKLNPEDSGAMWRLAEVLSWLGDDESAQEAVRVWDLAYSHGPPSSHSWTAFATRVRLNEQIHGEGAPRSVLWESIAYLERAIALVDNKASLWTRLASHHRRLGNESIGLEAADRALALEQHSASALEEQAMLLSDMGEYAEAEKAVNAILDRRDDTWPRALRAWILSRTARVDEAKKILERVVTQDTDTAWYRELLADCYRRTGDWEKVAPLDVWAFARRTEDKKNDLISYAWAALSMRQPSEAKRYFDRAEAETSTELFGVLAGSALASFALNDLQEGERLLRQAIDSASQRRQLDDFVAFTIPLVERLAATWAHGPEALTFLQRTALGEIEARRKALTKPPTSLEEIERVLTRFPDQDSRAIGPLATYARLFAEAGRADEAAVLYEQLLVTGVFPEGRNALVRAHRLRALREEERGQLSEAAASYERALRRAANLHAPHETARLHARLALLHLVGLRQAEYGRRNLRDGLAALPDEPTDAGYAYERILSDLVKDRTTFRKVSAALRAVAESPTEPRNLIEAARETLFWLFHQRYWGLELGVQRDTSLFPGATPITLDAGPGVLDEKEGGPRPLLDEYLPQMRETIQVEMGVRLPGVLLRQNDDLDPGKYALLIDEIPRAEGTVNSALDRVERHRQIAQHLESVCRLSLAEFLDMDDCIYGQFLGTPGDEARPSDLPSAHSGPLLPWSTALRLRRLLAALLEEEVPVADRDAILDALSATSTHTEASRQARLRLRDQLPGNEPGRRSLALDADFEHKAEQAICTDVCGREVLPLSPDRTQGFLTAIRECVDKTPHETWILQTQSDRLRPLLRAVCALEFPRLAVLSASERSVGLTQERPIQVVTSGLPGEWSQARSAIDTGSTAAGYLEWMVRGFFRYLVEDVQGQTEIAKDELETVYALGYHLFMSRRYSAAQRVFAPLAQLSSASHHWRALGAVYQQTGEYSDAIRAYTEALERDDADLVSRVYRAECQLLAGNRADALPDLERVDTSTSKGDTSWKKRAALLLQSMGQSR